MQAAPRCPNFRAPRSMTRYHTIYNSLLIAILNMNKKNKKKFQNAKLSLLIDR